MIKMKLFRGISIVVSCLCAASLLCGCESGTVSSGQSEQPIEIKIAHASSKESTTQLVCEAFQEKAVELLGEEQIHITIHPNATLGSEAEMVESIQMGTLEAGTFGRHSAIDKSLDVINLPFLFSDDDHVERVLRGSEGEKIREKMNEIIEKNGIVVLGWYETGFRVITSNKPINTLSDLKGLVIRTPSTETLLQSFQTWGAAPTAVDLADLYTALQSGVVDAQENPYQLIETNKLYEVQDYLCITNHLTIPNQLVFSKKVWDSYPENVQKALLEAGQYACEQGGEYNREQNGKLKDELESKMQVTYMDDASLQEMQQLAKENVWPNFINSEVEEIVEMIQDLR